MAEEVSKKRSPKVDDYYDELEDGYLGVMAKYKSFCLSPGADATLELLESLYSWQDEKYGKKQRGLINKYKLLGPVVGYLQEVSKEENAFFLDLAEDDVALAQWFNAMECQYVIAEQPVENPFRKFRKPTAPCLTRNGFIKYQIIQYIDGLESGWDSIYNTLVKIREKYDLRVPGTLRPIMPLEDKTQVDENFRALTRELGIPIERLRQQMRTFQNSRNKASNPMGPKPQSHAPSASDISSVSGASQNSTVRPSRSEYKPASGISDRIPSSIPKQKEAAPTQYQYNSSSSHSRPPPKRTLEHIQREKEELEIKKAEQELKDLEEQYDRELKDLKIKNDIEYTQAITRGLEEQARHSTVSAERMRRIGLEEYYPPYYY